MLMMNWCKMNCVGSFLGSLKGVSVSKTNLQPARCGYAIVHGKGSGFSIVIGEQYLVWQWGTFSIEQGQGERSLFVRTERVQ
jgi:hypothetical protein